MNVTPDALGWAAKAAVSTARASGSGNADAVSSWSGRRSEEKLTALESPAKRTRGKGRRAAATACGWCGGPITPRSRGPIPKWCSATCRHRAWEQARAAASGRAAVQVVERGRRRGPAPQRPRRGNPAWVHLLRELAGQLDAAVYDRDLVAIALAVDDVGRAVRRRLPAPQASPVLGVTSG